MKKNSKRFIALLMTMVTIFCLTVSASAAEATTNNSEELNGQHITYEVTSDGIVSVEYDGEVAPCSTISGYKNGSLTSSSAILKVPVTASGVGGMGITVKTSSSWNGYTSMAINSSDNTVYVENYALWSNDEVKFENFGHSSPSYIAVSLYGIPSGKSVYVEVWIYG